MKLNIMLIIILILSNCMKEVTINKEPVLFEIKKGETIFSISKNLNKAKIINNSKRFQVIAKLTGKDKMIKYGVYQIEPQEDYNTVLDKFINGKTYSIRITIPEGYNIFQIAELLESKEIVKKDEFLKECKNPVFLKKYNIPLNLSIEGYLYPDTYFIPYNYTPHQIIELFLKNFDTIVNENFRNKIKEKGLTLHKIITLASIIEKEAKVEYEKPIISGVYYNRIKKRMYFQSCPTLIYALTLDGLYHGDIKHSHFNYDSKYNTYKYFGFPPGPIANPGKASILAAIFPADVEYLYFVAKPDGSHYFSSSLEEHNRAVYLYQKLPAIEKRKNN